MFELYLYIIYAWAQHLTPPAPRLSSEEILKKANLVAVDPNYILPSDICRMDRERIIARADIIRLTNTSRRTRRIMFDEDDVAGRGVKRKSSRKRKGRGKRKSRRARR